MRPVKRPDDIQELHWDMNRAVYADLAFEVAHAFRELTVWFDQLTEYEAAPITNEAYLAAAVELVKLNYKLQEVEV